MNTFKLVAHNEYNFSYLEVTFDEENNLKQEIKYNKESIDIIPNIITSLYELSLWENTNKTLDDFKNLFLWSYNGLYFKPIKLTKDKTGIHGNNYFIHVNPAGILVNYKRGKFKEFTTLYDALDWITNVHYPAQQKKLINEILL